MADGAARRPSAAALVALGVDDWASLLAISLPVVRHLPEQHVDAVVRRVAAAPPGRLMSGRSRSDLAAVLAREPVWALVEEALPDDAPRPWEEQLPGAQVPDGQVPEGQAPDEAPASARLERQLAHLRERERTLAERVAALRGEVDALTRERDGAVARAETAATATEAALAERDAARDAAGAAEAAAAAADERVAREVARVRRREDGEVAGLRDQLRAARREADELRRALAAERTRPTAASAASGGASTSVPSAGTVRDDGSGRRGRPSRLPDGIAPGTRRAAEWLVAEGRVLLVDGYNVTRTQRPELSLADQRRWLEGAVTALARRRHVDATIVWDSAHGRSTTRRNRGGVTVRFTAAGSSADDELVLHVQLALDPDTPVVAVTDDAELRGRLARHGVDLLDSQSFTWLL